MESNVFQSSVFVCKPAESLVNQSMAQDFPQELHAIFGVYIIMEL